MKEKTYISDSTKVYASLRVTFPKQVLGGGDGYGVAKGVNVSITRLGTHTVKGAFSGTLNMGAEKLVISDGRFYLPRVN